MKGERRLLRASEYLVRRACQWLPPDVREERYREWAAELPAILHDPQIRPAARRAVRMLGYAADTVRGTAMTPGRARRGVPRRFGALDLLCLVSGLVVVALSTWSVAQAPGDGLNYLPLVWGLLFVAYLISKRVCSAGRVPALLLISSTLAAAARLLGDAAQAPGDWVNYVPAAVLLLPLLIGLLLVWWFRRLQARTGGRHAAPSDPWDLHLLP